MQSRALILRTAAAVVTILASITVPTGRCAAADPPSIRGLSSKSSLSADERNEIRDYSETYTARLLTSKDATEMRRVRAKLVDMVRGGATEVFRDTYSRYTVPGLERAIDKGSPNETVTALIVLSQLGTEQALDALVERSSVDREKRRHVRLAAARGCGHLFAGNLETGVISPKQIAGAARSLGIDVESEPDHHTLRRLIEAMLTAAQSTTDTGTRSQLHSQLVRAIEKIAERAASAPDETAANMLTAMYPSLHAFRIDFIQMEPSAQKALGRELGPCVRKVLDVATTHWSEFQGATGSGKSQLPEQFVTVCERFLATIDAVVRGQDKFVPKTQLSEAWRAGDLRRFESDLGRWRAVLSNPPY